jgi:hypothetical protein
MFFIVSVLTRALLTNTASPTGEWLAFLFRFQEVHSFDVTHGSPPS